MAPRYDLHFRFYTTGKRIGAFQSSGVAQDPYSQLFESPLTHRWRLPLQSELQTTLREMVP